MRGKLITRAGAGALAVILLALAGVGWLLDWLGRLAMLEEAAKREDLSDAAQWLFSTPWWVPAIFGAVLTVALIWELHRSATKTSAVQLADLSEAISQVREMRALFERHVKPRELSQEQMDAMEQFLIARPKHKIRIVVDQSNGEAARFAKQILQIFGRAHWDARMVQPKKDSDPLLLQEGLFLGMYFKMGQGPLAGKTEDDITRALGKAGIAFTATTATASATIEGSELDIALVVGHRPRV